MAALRIPSATYRLQFNRDFRFADARVLVSYLHKLGISDLYASPVFKAQPGSAHGYDIIDPTKLNPELGTEEEFEALAEGLRRHDMGLLLDIVPNHMAATVSNPWWADVLENGRDSLYAPFFDIEWDAHPEGRIVLPILDAPLDTVLHRGGLRLTLDEYGFAIRYHETRLPVSPRSIAAILSALPRPPERLASVLDSIRSGQPMEQLKRALWRLHERDPEVRRFMDAATDAFNGRDARPLRRLLGQQAYELTYWREGVRRLNYRRFFDVSALVAVRVEDPAVFRATHDVIVRLAREGKITGLRVDHIDGLRDPLEYLQRLQESLSPTGPPFYIVVEKILLDHEELPEEWPVAGTTGYEFANVVNALFVDSRGLEALDRTYRRFTGSRHSFSDVVHQQKKKATADLFVGELGDLGRRLASLAGEEKPGLRADDCAEAIMEVSACLSIYRTYMRRSGVSARDRAYVEDALGRARKRNPALAGGAIRFLRRVLLLDFPSSLPAHQRQLWLEFVTQWQQFTGPVTAKGLEDTALYNHNRLASLNDVGGDPGGAHVFNAVERFHQHSAKTLKRRPHTLNATSTHDTKRSEDVRARIDVLSEMPLAWARRLNRWSRMNLGKRRSANGRAVPDPHEEALLYQTLVGAWPFQAEAVPEFRERLKAYVIKAAREAKVNTSWLDRDGRYEGALMSFVEAVLDPSQAGQFLDDFHRFQQRIACCGALNSLCQTLIKITAPGVPDFYQGTELWDFSLVDPDNRRPVNFAERSRLLEDVIEYEAEDTRALLRRLLATWRSGQLKMYLTAKALTFRTSRAELFRCGDYIPLNAIGEKREQVVAFARAGHGEWAVVAAPRLAATLCSSRRPWVSPAAWEDTALPLPPRTPKQWVNILTGEIVTASRTGSARSLECRALFSRFPVALLSGISIH
jgi:(1->4)-alpha-D-glucan 1-alpha-D-glucosylmutase